MAADSRDPVTGAYIFLDGGAPDIAVDPTLVSEQANDVGTRIIRANLAALDSYTYERAGLWGHALDTKSDYLHDGSGWKLMHRPPTAYTPTFANFTAAPTITEARYSVFSGIVRVHMVLTLTGAIGASPTVSLPLTSRTPNGRTMLGQATYFDASPVQWIDGRVYHNSSTTVAPVAGVVAATLMGLATNINGATPFTWASGDSITLDFSYEAA